MYLDIKERLEDCTEPIKKPKIDPNNNEQISSTSDLIKDQIIIQDTS